MPAFSDLVNWVEIRVHRPVIVFMTRIVAAPDYGASSQTLGYRLIFIRSRARNGQLFMMTEH